MTKKAETPLRILWIAFCVCLVCSVVVASSAVLLQHKQAENRLLDRQRSILVVAGLATGNLNATQTRAMFTKYIQPRLIDFTTASTSTRFDPWSFDAKAAAHDDDLSIALTRDQDLAGIERRENYAVVYLVNNDQGDLDTVVLPVRGAGAWGPIYGLLALNADLRSTKNIIFYEHSETPGLGGEIDNPRWRALWRNVEAIDESSNVLLEITSTRDANSVMSHSQIDALAGATVTSNFVNDLTRFWLGKEGYGPWLAKVRAQGGRP